MSNAKVLAAALALPRAERFRLAAKLVEADDPERAADLEASARSVEMEEAPAHFVAQGSHKAFVAKLRAEIRKPRPVNKRVAA
ncbi:MAG: hypothetical protein EAZ36_04045 [Verrucomicrobia bacterium]|nr:MAG: hypothetical protein EAZ36_04045 [Verrucomicrobiota bacterium]